jgi:hypothetical protein
MTKIAGSISHWHGSADPDPDPHQNVMDPQHGGKKLKYKHEGSVVDLCQFGKDPDPRIRTTDPALFVRGLQEAKKKFSSTFKLITFGRYIYIIFSR